MTLKELSGTAQRHWRCLLRRTGRWRRRAVSRQYRRIRETLPDYSLCAVSFLLMRTRETGYARTSELACVGLTHAAESSVHPSVSARRPGDSPGAGGWEGGCADD